MTWRATFYCDCPAASSRSSEACIVRAACWCPCHSGAREDDDVSNPARRAAGFRGVLVLALNELLRGTRWAHLTARAGEAPATVMGARRDSQDRTGVLRAVAHRTQRDTAREWGSSNAASRGVATKVVAAVSHGEMTSLLFSCRAELGELHALAREAAVSYSLHYSETEDAWYVTVDSAAPAECYVTKTRTLPIALGMALEHLRKLVSRG